jgi:enoyl-[acyl-carrier-protein] reductase (NADH)
MRSRRRKPCASKCPTLISYELDSNSSWTRPVPRTKVAAIELAEFGIRVNCVAPGAIVTERTLRDDPEYEATWAKAAPLGRIGVPRDIGQAVVFLASEQASFISGQTIWVDGAAFTMPNWPYKLR